MSQAPPAGYGVGPSSFTTNTVTVVNVPEEPNDIKGTDEMFSFNEKSVRMGKLAFTCDLFQFLPVFSCLETFWRYRNCSFHYGG